jgi:hypothetical protein
MKIAAIAPAKQTPEATAMTASGIRELLPFRLPAGSPRRRRGETHDPRHSADRRIAAE